MRFAPILLVLALAAGGSSSASERTQAALCSADPVPDASTESAVPSGCDEPAK